VPRGSNSAALRTGRVAKCGNRAFGAPVSGDERIRPGPGGVISGATTAVLTIAGVSAADAGSYDVVVSNSCGSATSAAAELTVRSVWARGDLNCDGLVNNFDIDPFVLALSDPTAYAAAFPECDRTNADVNEDGRVDNFDIDPFVVLLGGGAP
jgi:hypothetical protein